MHALRVKKRTAAVFLLMLGCFSILLGRIFFIQVFKAPWLQAMAKTQRTHQIPVEAHRGAITDRNGRILADSIDADCVGVIPAEIDDPAAVAAALAPLLSLDASKLETRLRQHTAFVWIKRRITRQESQAVKVAALPGVIVTPRAQRYYPKGLAGQLLGFAGIDNQGLEGLEIYYDAELRGQRGWVLAEISALNTRIPSGEQFYQDSVDGYTLCLTIDERIQFIAERELAQAMAETGSKRGLVILMDPENGEILALAVRPGYDPNNYAAYPQANWRNIAVTDQYEPGSTFKIVTAAAALEEHIVNLDTGFYDPGYITVDDRQLHCWRHGGHGSQTFLQAVENSCNPVFASLALSLGQERFYRYIKAFGFGERTGIDCPGEAAGSVSKLPANKRVELATRGYGQGISVTAVQMVAAAAAIANGGSLIKPHLLKELKDAEGRVVRQGRTEVVREVISRETAATMRMVLESVVVNGSGNRANVPGYRVAGKTGTAQKPGPGGYTNEVIASFLGFAPADRPRLVGLVLLDEPSCGVRYGGVIAAPVFGRIIGNALRTMNVPVQIATKPTDDDDLVTVPNLLHLPSGDAQAALIRLGLRPQLTGEGSFIFDQTPKPGARVTRGTAVLLYFDPEEKYNKFNDEMVKVPDISGLDPGAVQKILSGLGLRLIVIGEGRAQAQEPRAGALVNKGTPITVKFAPVDSRPG